MYQSSNIKLVDLFEAENPGKPYPSYTIADVTVLPDFCDFYKEISGLPLYDEKALWECLHLKSSRIAVENSDDIFAFLSGEGCGVKRDVYVWLTHFGSLTDLPRFRRDDFCSILDYLYLESASDTVVFDIEFKWALVLDHSGLQFSRFWLKSV